MVDQEEAQSQEGSKLPTIILIILLAASFGGLVFLGNKLKKSQETNVSNGTASPQAQNNQQPTEALPSPVRESAEVLGAEDREALVAKGVKYGQDEAAVTIVEFSDPSCPFCQAVAGSNQEVIDYLRTRTPEWQPALPKIIDEYVEKGLVKLVFHYFPGHGTGQKAIEAIWCADEQGKGWEMKELVYAQGENVENIDPLSLAGELKLDQDKISTCLQGDFQARVNEELELGKRVEVGGTPTFFINGQRVIGAQDFVYFKGFIDSELGNR